MSYALRGSVIHTVISHASEKCNICSNIISIHFKATYLWQNSANKSIYDILQKSYLRIHQDQITNKALWKRTNQLSID